MNQLPKPWVTFAILTYEIWVTFAVNEYILSYFSEDGNIYLIISICFHIEQAQFIVVLWAFAKVAISNESEQILIDTGM